MKAIFKDINIKWLRNDQRDDLKMITCSSWRHIHAQTSDRYAIYVIQLDCIFFHLYTQQSCVELGAGHVYSYLFIFIKKLWIVTASSVLPHCSSVFVQSRSLVTMSRAFLKQMSNKSSRCISTAFSFKLRYKQHIAQQFSGTLQSSIKDISYGIQLIST